MRVSVRPTKTSEKFPCILVGCCVSVWNIGKLLATCNWAVVNSTAYIETKWRNNKKAHPPSNHFAARILYYVRIYRLVFNLLPNRSPEWGIPLWIFRSSVVVVRSISGITISRVFFWFNSYISSVAFGWLHFQWILIWNHVKSGPKWCYRWGSAVFAQTKVASNCHNPATRKWIDLLM